MQGLWDTAVDVFHRSPTDADGVFTDDDFRKNFKEKQ
jgi:hypothetical protein